MGKFYIKIVIFMYKKLKVNKKKEQFVDTILQSVLLFNEAEQMSYKQLADHIIYNYPKDYKLGSKECAVLDRVILILQRLEEFEKDIKKSVNLVC